MTEIEKAHCQAIVIDRSGAGVLIKDISAELGIHRRQIYDWRCDSEISKQIIVLKEKRRSILDKKKVDRRQQLSKIGALRLRALEMWQSDTELNAAEIASRLRLSTQRILRWIPECGKAFRAVHADSLKLLRHTEAKPGIYFLLADAPVNRIKIGYATHLAERMKAIRNGCPVPTRLLAYINGTIDDERALHRIFKAERLQCEWFEPSERLMAFIANANNSKGLMQDMLWCA